jgi:hypothetical protein
MREPHRNLRPAISIGQTSVRVVSTALAMVFVFVLPASPTRESRDRLEVSSSFTVPPSYHRLDTAGSAQAGVVSAAFLGGASGGGRA